MLTASQRLAAESDGAFDVTQGPVIRLWREARRTRKLPDPAALIEAADRTGYRNLRIKNDTVTLLLPRMQLDLGGIAKGYAADEALALLNRAGLRSALVAASGDLAIGHPPPEKSGWAVGLGSLRERSEASVTILTLSNCAVSTSGDTEQFAEINGQRYSHIIDPHTPSTPHRAARRQRHRPARDRLRQPRYHAERARDSAWNGVHRESDWRVRSISNTHLRVGLSKIPNKAIDEGHLKPYNRVTTSGG